MTRDKMKDINRSSLFSSIDSFQYYIPLTSTPKRLNKSHYSQPLSSTLLLSNNSLKKFDLSISVITLIKKPSLHYKKRHRRYHRPRNPIHSSTIIKRIELKDLLYLTRAMKKQQENKQRHYTKNEMKIYLV
ncbi:unnamed protein product [Rotaria sordida]|uniref:Uncharacterized protein n=2 Tax=Rotaria sordida TaxID=392033 RepID=A0A815HFI3_9BILA|nr:unnamed protein product [Rotaria sordida]CAF1351612.1 unnamed protein product [Rotaria sordida]CAF1585294.1 unnamed protein product [Rotaria sordida]CAF4102807.1 unnamed protein product [Rotaria sordida]